MASAVMIRTKSNTRARDLRNKLKSIGIEYDRGTRQSDERTFRIWNGTLRGSYTTYRFDYFVGIDERYKNPIKIHRIMAVKTAEELYDLITELRG